MNNSRLSIVLALSLLAACSPQRPQLTTDQVKSVAGYYMQDVQAKLGPPFVVTNAGDSVWWNYNNIVTPNGYNDGTCQIVFKHEKVDSIKC